MFADKGHVGVPTAPRDREGCRRRRRWRYAAGRPCGAFRCVPFAAVRPRSGVGPARFVSGELVLALDAFLDVSGELVGAQGRPVLDSDAVLQEQRHVGGDDRLLVGLAFHDDVEPKGARVPQLVESQVSEFHLPSGTKGPRP